MELLILIVQFLGPILLKTVGAYIDKQIKEGKLKHEDKLKFIEAVQGITPDDNNAPSKLSREAEKQRKAALDEIKKLNL